MRTREVADRDGAPVHSEDGVYHCSWHMTRTKQELRVTFKLWGLGSSWNYMVKMMTKTNVG